MSQSSPNWTLDVRDLLSLLVRAELCDGATKIPRGMVITSLTDDSRAVVPGGCYVAVRGTVVDGHRFIDDAIRGGARLLVMQKDHARQDIPAGVVALRVSDTRKALAFASALYFGLDRSRATLPLIGVTGTNGKTTVCYLLRSILRAAGRTPAMLGTVEYDLVGSTMPAPLTTPGPLELCRHLAQAKEAGAKSVVMEVSSHALDQCRCDGLSFAAAVFTNLSGDHIDYHGSMDDYLRAKRRLFDSLDDGAVAIVNADDDRSKRIISKTRASVRTFGLDETTDVTASNLRLTATSSRFILGGCTYEVAVESRLVGVYNVMNVLAAAATAEALGVDADAIAEGIEGLKGVPGRLQRVTDDAHPFQVYVDYAHTDAALENVLGVLESLTDGRLICVFGCGGDRDRSKRPRMALAVGRRADQAIVTSDNPRSERPQRIIEDILAGFDEADGCEVVVEPDRRKAIGEALNAASPGDTVLIAGKGHEDYQIIGDHKRPFDDQVVARQWLKAVTDRSGVGLRGRAKIIFAVPCDGGLEASG